MAHTHITSTKNEYIKQLRSLKQVKYRREYGKFLAEGEKCAWEALTYARVEALLLPEQGGNETLRALAEQKGVEVLSVSQPVLEAVSDNKTPQPAIAVVSGLVQREIASEGVLVVLEDVSDPTNIGAIFRTADAIGAAGVLLSANCADHTSSRAVRASMGSLFHVPVRVEQDLCAALRGLQADGWRMVGGHLKGQSRLQPAAKSCLLIGNESRGLSEEISALCDDLVKIHIYGQAESLNASVAAGILMYRLKEGF